MRKLTRLPYAVSLLLVLLFTPSFAADFKRGGIYQIVIDRFFDGNAANNNPPQSAGLFDATKTNWRTYWGGDLQGIQQTMSYPAGMGVTAIWISPPVDNLNTNIPDGSGNPTASSAWILVVPSSALFKASSFLIDSSQQHPRKIDPEILKKLAGRYELEVGIMPISTLDVSLENGELWIKPSGIRKHRLLHKSNTMFLDELDGTPFSFNQDDEGRIVSLKFVYEGEDYTASRITLPAPTFKGNTTFRLKGYADASIVALAGSFNDWNQSQYIFGREGSDWVCRIDLKPGKYSYKLIVDGDWMLDPSNPNTEEDDVGNKNSIITLAGEKRL